MPRLIEWDVNSETRIKVAQTTQKETGKLTTARQFGSKAVARFHTGFIEAWGVSHNGTLVDFSEPTIKKGFEALPGVFRFAPQVAPMEDQFDDPSIIPDVDDISGTNGHFIISVAKHLNAFDVAKGVLHHMRNKDYISADELITAQEKLGITDNPLVGTSVQRQPPRQIP